MPLEVLKSVTKKEMLKSVALARGRHIEALVVELPRGMLTANATEGLEGSDILKSVIELLRRLQSVTH